MNLLRGSRKKQKKKAKQIFKPWGESCVPWQREKMSHTKCFYNWNVNNVLWHCSATEPAEGLRKKEYKVRRTFLSDSAKIFSFAWQILTCNSNQKRRLRGCPGGVSGLRTGCGCGGAKTKQDNILWPVLRCLPEIGQKRVSQKVQTKRDWANPIQNAIRHSNFIHFSIQFQGPSHSLPCGRINCDLDKGGTGRKHGIGACDKAGSTSGVTCKDVFLNSIGTNWMLNFLRS